MVTEIVKMEDSEVSFSQGFRLVFYLLTPHESSFSQVTDVPHYLTKAAPFFLGLLLMELLVGWLRNGELLIKINDGITSISAGLMSCLPQLFVRGLEISSYIYVWNNFHILELPWDSVWTWWLTLLGVDFGYYWLHRFSHEVNLLWAAHQVHHSSEYYNLSTALRQSVTQQCASWIFYLPLALAIPPSVFAIHVQFNLLYQFWIHTEIIGNLGLLELVLNTPSHHRVHHGRNPYCIDKNYGGTLIIWDRLFGTFAQEDEKVVYGLTRLINTFDVLAVQFHYYPYLWESFQKASGVANKLSIIFKGPSWTPGKPRLGDHAEVPKVTGEEVPHNPKWPLVTQAYVFTQFVMLMGAYNDMLSSVTLLTTTGYLLLSLTSMGFIIEQKSNAAMLETVRCFLMMLLHRLGYIKPLVPLLSAPTEAFISLSLLYWGLQVCSQLANIKKKQQ